MFVKPVITHIPEDVKIALLAGGNSGERPISLKSAEGAANALKRAGYEVEQLDPADKESLGKLITGDYQVAFLCLHGKGGEDGAIQGFLQTVGIPYTCSGIFGSAVCIDKARAKVFYEKEGIPTPPSITLMRGEDVSVSDIQGELGEKMVVKAATEGSSIGVYIADTAKALDMALREALEIDDKVVVEKYITGKELTCVVLGDGDAAQALPIIEIIPRNVSYDFESKYAPGGSEHICPARIDEISADEIQRLAVLAHNALGCAGVSRTDFILQEDGSAWALETNTIPGMTDTSLLPDAAKAAGISFPELCTYIVESALSR